MSDRRLLDEYAKSGSEQAFNELVNRFLGLVYSTAMRQLGNPSAAEEVAQAVFCLLAEKARAISSHVLLGGWLYQTTCHKCSEYRRADHRRRVREQEAAAMHELSQCHESDQLWEKLEPMLDNAVGELDELDRQAVVLRFFERKPFREIGAELNLDDDAARKRVSRAVDKLRGWFETKGIVCQADALAIVLLACCTRPAPSAMAGLVAKTALAGVAAASIPAAATILSKSIVMTKSTLAAASAAIIVFSVPSVMLWNQNQNLSNELSSLRAQIAEETKQRQSAQAALKTGNEEMARLRAQQTELLRLRGETAQLRRQAAAAKNSPAPVTPQPERQETPANPGKVEASFQARIPSGQTLVTGGWQTQPGLRALALVSPTSVDAAGNTVDAAAGNTQVLIQAIMIEVPDAVWNSMNLETPASGGNAANQKNILTQDKAKELVDQLTSTAGVSLLSAPRVQTVEGSPAGVHIGNSEQGEGLNLSFNPHLVSGENSYDISVGVEMAVSPSSSSNSSSVSPKAIQSVPAKAQ